MRLVSGATGLVGSYVTCTVLLQGMKVRALKRKGASTDWFYRIAKACNVPQNILDNQLDWVEGDLDDVLSLEEALQGVERVYHCAAVVSFRRKDKDLLFKTNVEGTANLVNACLFAGVKKICYMSSIAALSRKKNEDNIDETAEWEESSLNSNYAKSKFLGELEIWRGQEEGLQVVIVNPGFVLGFGNPERSSASIFKKVAKGFSFYTHGINGYVDVVDVAKSAVLLTEGQIQGERFVLVSENLSYKELFFGIAKNLGVKLPSIEVKPWMAKLAIMLLKILSFVGIRTKVITPETITTSISKYYYSSEKLKKITGFEFLSSANTIERIAKEFNMYGGNSLK